MRNANKAFLGCWRITSAPAWEADALHLFGTPFIDFANGRLGFLRLASIQGDIDYRITQRQEGPIAEWSWDGANDNDRGSGRGWAVIVGEQLHGHLYIHLSDESSFVAVRDPEAIKGLPGTT